jgi:hypothetical protein
VTGNSGIVDINEVQNVPIIQTSSGQHYPLNDLMYVGQFNLVEACL